MSGAFDLEGLQPMLDLTSAAITQVGEPDAAAWRFARCWMLITRFGASRRAPDLSAAIGDFDALPNDLPGRSKLASVLVTTMMQAQEMKHPAGLERVATLTAVADEDPEPLAGWRPTSAAVRARVLLETAMRAREAFDVRAALAELDGLAAVAAGTRPQADLVESSRIALRSLQAALSQDAPGMAKVADDLNDLFAAGSGSLPAEQPTAEARSAGPLLAVVKAMAEVQAAAGRGDLTAASAAMDRATAAAELLPPGDPRRTDVADLRATFEGILAGLEPDATPATGAAGLDRLRALAEQPGLPPAERATHLGSLAFAEIAHGSESPELLESAIGHLRTALDLATEHDPRRVHYLMTLGVAHLTRLELLAMRDDLREGIRLLEEARAAAGSDQHALWTMLSNPLANAYRIGGQRARGRETALDGLRGHAWNALLQPTLADVQAAARDAGGDAVDVARWCMEDNDAASAALALDAGRALILYAATETRDLRTRLTERGRPDLADRWPSSDAAEVPLDLRREAIGVLAGLTADVAGPVPLDAGSARLLAPPDLDELRIALRSLEADALVYLVSGSERSGAAVVVPADEEPRWILLPQLRSERTGDFDTFLTTTSVRDAVRPSGSSLCEVGRTLDEICDWAWKAAVGPLLEQFSGTPRLILIPMGELVRVPWHAARHQVGGRVRYAVEDAVFSYAPSARLLCDVTWRGSLLPAAGGLIVGDPDTDGAGLDLRAARAEAWAIRETFYPDARYLGRTPDDAIGPDGPGTRTELLHWLSAGDAGTILHLACHGVVDRASGSGDTSYLLLSSGERLSAEELVGSVSGRPISLAVLAACSSGVCARGDDEAFSLSTTLLAGAARTVIGTQWSVPDEATSVFMFMFHHYLRVDGLPPADALRAAQLWMITPSPRVPDGMPESLRDSLRGSDQRAPVAWAGFVHAGR